MKRIMTAALVALTATAAQAAPCGLSGKWISDESGAVELLIIEGASWERYVGFRFAAGGEIVARTEVVLRLRNDDDGEAVEWRYAWQGVDHLKLTDAEGDARLFIRLETCRPRDVGDVAAAHGAG